MKLTTQELLSCPSFSPVCGGEDRPVEGIYCCDLLSLVMGRAKAGDCWITVMGNVNAVAVATLADAACILLAEGMAFDPAAVERARQQGIALLRTELPVYEAARLVEQLGGGL